MNASLLARMKAEHFQYTSIDLFSGPGGLCTGFKWAGILPLIAVEWSDTTVLTYSVNHNADIFELSEYLNNGSYNTDYSNQFYKESTKSVIIHGDINKVSNSLILDLLRFRYGIDSKKETVDVVSGGAPCESFSLQGQRNANDERDDLFSNILRIARTVKAKLVLFENVKGLLSKSRDGVRGAIFKYICDSFEDNTKKVKYKLASRSQNIILLKAADFGVPQLRERLFLVGIRSDLKIQFSYPVPIYGANSDCPYITVKEALVGLPTINMNEESRKYNAPKKFSSKNEQVYQSIMRGEYEDDSVHANVPSYIIEKGLFNSKSISSHKAPGHVKKKQQLLALIRENESMMSCYDRLVKEGSIDNYRELFPKTLFGSRNRRLNNNEPSFTVTSHCLDEMLHPVLNRAITPREAARLQSFPDWYQFEGPYVAFHSSKEQDRYEQIGDAIPPLLACAIAKELVSALNQQ